MTIGELSATSGLAASAIRYWERIGVLPKPARVNGQRRYGPDAVNRLAVLRLAQACGFRLNEMRRLLTGFPPTVPASRRWQELAQRKLRDLDEQLARLNAMRELVQQVRQCQCADLSDCGRIANAAMAIGQFGPRARDHGHSPR